MSLLSSTIKKNRKLVNEILQYLKPYIIKKLEKQLKKKIDENSIRIFIQFIEELEF